jgi:mono/diheme cytochrome c family protein
MRSALLLAALAAPATAQDPLPGAEEGAAIFATHCAVCHGAEARGGGPMAPLLSVAPPDLTGLLDDEGAFPRFWVMRRIDGRDPFLAHGGPMPVWGDELDGPRIMVDGPGGQPILVSENVAAVTAWLESVQAD